MEQSRCYYLLTYVCKQPLFIHYSANIQHTCSTSFSSTLVSLTSAAVHCVTKTVFRHDLWVTSGKWQQSLPAVCLSLAQRSSGRIFADAFTTATNPPHYSGKRWSSYVQQAEAGSDVLTAAAITRSFWQYTHTGVGSYHHKLYWHLHLCTLCVCHCFFTRRLLFYFL